MNRRGFLQACLAAAAAPYVSTAAGVLMPVRKVFAAEQFTAWGLQIERATAPSLFTSSVFIKKNGNWMRHSVSAFAPEGETHPTFGLSRDGQLVLVRGQELASSTCKVGGEMPSGGSSLSVDNPKLDVPISLGPNGVFISPGASLTLPALPANKMYHLTKNLEWE